MNDIHNTRFFIKFNIIGLLVCLTACIGVLGYAFYLQHYQYLAPCPLCVIQRYAFSLIALCCIAALFFRKRLKLIAIATGAVSALFGGGVAAYHLWIKANPAMTCGIDPLETALNQFFLAHWLPSLFYADGLCTANHAPILGLHIPQWSLIWFVLLVSLLLLLFITALENNRRSLVSS